MLFIYLDKIHYQTVGDAKAPLLRVIDTNRHEKNGYANSIEPNHREVSSTLAYKKFLVNNIQKPTNRNRETCTICGRRRRSCFDFKNSKVS